MLAAATAAAATAAAATAAAVPAAAAAAALVAARLAAIATAVLFLCQIFWDAGMCAYFHIASCCGQYSVIIKVAEQWHNCTDDSAFLQGKLYFR